jgi:hypothetical protein
MAVRVVFVPITVDTEHMSRIGREGARVLHERYDGQELTRAARAAFDARFVNLVDPECELPETERAERVRQARREYFTRLSRQAAAARRARKTATETAVA